MATKIIFTLALFSVLGVGILAKRKSELCPPAHVHFVYDNSAADGVSHWGGISQETHCCQGYYQSPIDIQTSQLTCHSFRALQYTGPAGPLPGTIVNNGHSASIAFLESIDLQNVPFSKGKYTLSSLHFHVLSEHSVDNKHFDGELHLVHYKKTYGSLAAAVDKADGLAVIGIFLKLSDTTNNKNMLEFAEGVTEVEDKGETSSLSIDPRSLLPPSGHFYTYQGSLTTPSCSESVRWIVMQDPLLITEEELAELGELKNSEGVTVKTQHNNRPTQPVHERKLYSNAC